MALVVMGLRLAFCGLGCEGITLVFFITLAVGGYTGLLDGLGGDGLTLGFFMALVVGRFHWAS